MAALPPLSNEAALRALDAKCKDSSAESERAALLLGLLPLGTRKGYLHRAIMLDLRRIVRCVLQHVDVDVVVDEDDDCTGLHLAALSDSPHAMKALLKSGANHALTLTNGQTPLIVAARFGSLRCVRLLVDAGADAKVASLYLGQTPLMAAVAYKHLECARENVFHVAVRTVNEDAFELLLPRSDERRGRALSSWRRL